MSNIASYGVNQVAVGTAAVQLDSAGFSDVEGVVLKAMSTNSGIVYFGQTSSVTAGNGYELTAGQSLLIPVDNADQIWVIGSATNQKVCYMAAQLTGYN